MAIISVHFGESGSRKTTSMGSAAEYLYERTGGKRGRAIYSDGGGWQVIKGAVDAGLVEPYNIQDEPDLPLLLHKLARGWWPTALVDGLRPRDAKLAPPTDATWKEVGWGIFEGLTSTSELLMKYLRDKQISIGGDPIGKFKIDDPYGGAPMLFCANNLKHYDFVQGEMLTVLAEFAGQPVERWLITAHEAEGTDDGDRAPIRGPALVGKAGTTKVAKNVGDCIHYEVVSKAVGALIQNEVRCYYVPHPDQKFANISYKCKSRIPEAQVGALDKAFPGGYFAPNRLGEFLRVTDELVARSGDEFAARKKAIDTKLAGTAAI